MNFQRCLLLLIFIMVYSSNAQSIYKVYFFAGQSNMVGLGKVNELPIGLNKEDTDTFIFHGSSSEDGNKPGGTGVWTTLKPGHGFLFGSDGVTNQYSDLFGPELSFSQRMKELDAGSNIAVVKYARVGTSIDSAASKGFGYWHPAKKDNILYNQFDHFKETVKNAFEVKDINGDGLTDILIPAGILWMQGESDAAYTKEIALSYKRNLSQLIKAIRELLNNEHLPVVIGQIANPIDNISGKQWPFAEIVRDAQQSFVSEDKFSALVDTDKYGFSDSAHYDTDGFINLGYDFAKAIKRLEESSN